MLTIICSLIYFKQDLIKSSEVKSNAHRSFDSFKVPFNNLGFCNCCHFFFLLFGHILLEIASSALKVECILRGVRQPFVLLSEGITVLLEKNQVSSNPDIASFMWYMDVDVALSYVGNLHCRRRMQFIKAQSYIRLGRVSCLQHGYGDLISFACCCIGK